MLNRFWRQVKVSEDGCWLWTGPKCTNGYGMMYAHPKPNLLVHRFSWTIHHALDIPPKACVLHHCDNPPCVRPDHLFLGDAKANTQDMLKKKRNEPAIIRRLRARLFPDAPPIDDEVTR